MKKSTFLFYTILSFCCITFIHNADDSEFSMRTQPTRIRFSDLVKRTNHCRHWSPMRMLSMNNKEKNYCSSVYWRHERSNIKNYTPVTSYHGQKSLYDANERIIHKKMYPCMKWLVKAMHPQRHYLSIIVIQSSMFSCRNNGPKKNPHISISHRFWSEMKHEIIYLQNLNFIALLKADLRIEKSNWAGCGVRGMIAGKQPQQQMMANRRTNKARA